MKHRFDALLRAASPATARLAASLTLALALPAAALAGATISTGSDSYLTLDYSLQAWAQLQSYTSPTDSGRAWDSYLRRNRLTFSGQYNDYVGFYAQLEAGNDGKDGEVDRSTYFRDAYVTVDYTDALRLIIGRFKNGFSRENNEACLEPLTLDRSDISYTPFAGTRDTGVALWGNLLDAKLQYRLVVGDGREGDYVARKNPRLTARVHWSLLDPESDYGYRGTYLGTRTVLTLGAAVDHQAGVAYGNYAARKDIKDYKAWTVDVFGEWPTRTGTYTASAAYFNYDTGGAINLSPDPDLPSNTQLKAYYVKGGYLLREKLGPGRLQFFGRHERADYHLSGGGLDHSTNTVGANYYFDGQRLKLTVEHGRTSFRVPSSTNAALQNNWQTTLGFQFIF
jgi:hypothetical protein